MPFLRNGVAEDADPYLVDALSALGDTYGPLGVAIVAAGLTDANVLIDELHDEVADADAEEREPVHTFVVPEAKVARSVGDYVDKGPLPTDSLGRPRRPTAGPGDLPTELAPDPLWPSGIPGLAESVGDAAGRLSFIALGANDHQSFRRLRFRLFRRSRP